MEYGITHDGFNTYLNPSFWDPQKRLTLSKTGLLTKLHGSVMWQNENGRIIPGASIHTPIPSNHCILHPGYKGEPTEEPFRVFHKHLQRVVRGQYGKLTVAVFVGFAFRDPYINRILEDLPSNTLTIFFTKLRGSFISSKPPPNAPHVEQSIHFREGLTEKSAASSLERIADKKGRASSKN